MSDRRAPSGWFVVTGALLVLLAAGPGAISVSAESPWTTLGNVGITNLEEVSAVRGDDGVLHVAWRSAPSPGRPQFRYRKLDPDGRMLGEEDVVLEGWNSLSPPTLEFSQDGSIVLWFGGIRGSNDPKDPYNRGSLYQLVKDADGGTWGLVPGAKAQNSNAYVGPIGLTRDLDGEAWTAWAAGTNLVVQKGLGEAPVDSVNEPGCCPYLPEVATEVGGEVIVGWYSNANSQQGILLRKVFPQRGEIVVAPESYVVQGGRQASLQIDNQLAISSRLGGGVFVAYCAGYPVCESVRLWKYGSQQALEVSKGQSARAVNITRAPEGRLWVMWLEEGHLMARRSNKAATRFGRETRVAMLPSVHGYHANGEGSVGPLDAFVNVQSEIVHTRVLPPLEATTNPSLVMSEEGAEVIIAVTDAGDPVENAETTFNGNILRSDSEGNIRLVLPPGSPVGKLSLEINKLDYQSASVGVVVKPKPPEKP